ncbi:MAG TPA: MFS transporter [Candidatus Methylomirabilis sp.]|nr:MFS transporter [Candidatus Methylomirabilis sp.]
MIRWHARASTELSAGAVLSEPGYRRLFVSGLLVNIARWMDLVTLGWLALQLTGSPFLVGLAVFARTAPLMVGGPFAGIVADRASRARVLVVAQTTSAATSLALAMIFGSGLGSYGTLIACEAVLGLMWTLDFPARRTALYSLLGPSRVAQAVSLETVSMQVAKIVGPLLAGACLARVGPSGSFTLMAASYAGGMIASLGLGPHLAVPRVARSLSVAESLRAGLHAAWGNATVRAVLLVTIAMNTLFFPYQPMLPVFAKDVLAVGPIALGALVAGEGCGSLLGALVIASGRSGLAYRTLFGGSVLLGPGLLIALSRSRWLALGVVLLFLMGLADSGFSAMQTTLVLLSVPDRVRGGVMGILSACIGTQPLGTLTIGALATALGTPLTFALNAVAALVVIVPLAIPLVRGEPEG